MLQGFGQNLPLYRKILVEKLNKIGVKDSDILFIAAVGTHRLQEEEDFINLIGEDLYKRIRIENHLCDGEVVETGRFAWYRKRYAG